MNLLPVDHLLSRRAAILSLRFVLYRFSIMLCAVFFGGWPFSGLPSGSSESDGDFLFLTLMTGSGDECDDAELARPLLRELGL